MEWFYAENGQQIGPLSEADFDVLPRQGTVTPDTLVWHTGMADWQPYSTVRHMALATGAGGVTTLPDTATAVCAECGQTFASQEMLRYRASWVCTTCKPVFFQKLKEGLYPGNTLVYAGFWRRVRAKLVDGFILWGVNFAVNLGLGFWLQQLDRNIAYQVYPYLSVVRRVLSWGGMIAYGAYFVGKYGATPGKMAYGLHVVTPEGGKVGYGRALGRVFADMLSEAILGIGYLIAAWDGEKRTLHDRLCQTRVVRKS
jgi:uncharacterized RDD family membrane protein YckC